MSYFSDNDIQNMFPYQHSDCCCGATSSSNNVAGQAGVVSRVRQPCFIDDQVVVGSSVDIDVFKRTHKLFIL